MSLVFCNRGHHLIPRENVTHLTFGNYCPLCLGWLQYLAANCHALRELRELVGPGYGS